MNKKPFSQLFHESEHGKNVWTRHGDSMSKTFRNKLHLLYNLLKSPTLDDDFREDEWKSMRRLGWGYNIFNSTLPTKPIFCTKDCHKFIKQRKKSKLIKDHFYGVTEAAEAVKTEFEKSNFDIDYMVNEWLPKNYHIFVSWYVTKEEHKKKNIDRPSKNKKYTIEEKDNYKHFIGSVSDVVEIK